MTYFNLLVLRPLIGFGVLLIISQSDSFTAFPQQPKGVEVLRIGTSGGLAFNESGKEGGALETLKSFIKSETGFDNEIIAANDWQKLTEMLMSDKVHLGVYQGYEFAWTQENQPALRPLAIAVNGPPHRYAYILARKDSSAADFGGLEGKSIALPQVNQGYLKLFVERQTQARNKTLETFFSRITHPDNLEDPIDDVVDGMVDAAVIDRAGLDAYKRRKPARFNRLKEIARSQAFPSPLVAYREGVLDKETLHRFQEGLLNANRKEKGRSLLTHFKLTGFQAIPDDFDRVLAEFRKSYPAPLKDQSSKTK